MFNSVILAGIIQGLIFGIVVLFLKKYRNKSVYFLTAIIIIYSLSNLQFYLTDIGFITYDDLYRYYYIPWGHIVPALFYFYVINYLNATHKTNKIEYLLFVPFLYALTLSIVYKIAEVSKIKDDWVNNLMYYLAGYDELLMVLFHIIIFIILFLKIKKYRKQNVVFDKNHIKLHVNWLIVTLLFMSIVLVLWAWLTISYLKHTGPISFYPFWISMAILIYWFGHVGIYKYGVVEQRKQIRNRQISPKEQTKGKTKNIIIERLKEFLVDEKQFLDASLTLEKTANALELSQGHLSKIINTELQMSFKDYLNELRVEEAKSYLKNSEFSNYTLVAIGLEAGFNSKSAFNASFKKIAGETPSQFKQRHIN